METTEADLHTQSSRLESPTIRAAYELIETSTAPRDQWDLLAPITRLLRALLDIPPGQVDHRDRWSYECVVAAAAIVMLNARALQGNDTPPAEVVKELDEATLIAKSGIAPSQPAALTHVLNQERDQAVEMLDCLNHRTQQAWAQIDGLALEIASTAAGAADQSYSN